MDAALPVFARWLHIFSMAALFGGVLYAAIFADTLSPGFKRLAYVLIAAILASGLYNFLRRDTFPPNYHLWFGIKILLALHLFAAVLVYKGKRRTLTGAAISGALVIAISAFLRYLSFP